MKNDQSAHTPGEWSQTGLQIRHKDSGVIIATVYPHLESNMSKQRQLANSDRIVKAVNMHDDLVEMLKAANSRIADLNFSCQVNKLLKQAESK